MNDLDRDKLKFTLNIDVARRMLIKYFIDKDKKFAESFDLPVNPIELQDMNMTGTGLDTKIEIIPHVINIDPATSRARIGWNLFVLGHQRMYIGETLHGNLMSLAAQIRAGTITDGTVVGTRRCTTPKRIVAFVERVLLQSEDGYVDLTINQQFKSPKLMKPTGMSSNMSGSFYTRSSYGSA
jgi:hypothetical protein